MAAKAVASSNPLVVPGKPDTSLNVQLHPLVLLTISDYITRHTLRQQDGAMMGAIIGQQSGRSFTLEHAYECKLAEPVDEALLDGPWFTERLDMYKEVHKAPALDLVALFMLGPVEGPQPEHLPIFKQVRELVGSDSIMLLLFHPDQVNDLSGAKLPISLYESVQEFENEQVQLRFKELAFEVETGDAEMIGVNSVATGGGNATAVPKAELATPAAASAGSSSKDKKGKGKGKAKETDEPETNGASANALSPEDDELISTLNSKVNAIKMLNDRLNLIRSYLESLPTSSLTDPSSTDAPPDSTNFTLLRSVKAMLSRLPLLAPPNPSIPESTTATATSDEQRPPQTPNLHFAADKEKEDVHLTSLLASLTRSIAEVNSLSSKFHVLQREKQSRERAPYGGRGGGGGGGGRMGVLADEGLMTDNGGF